ncbi:MAG: PD40 domain-containing protein [Anaerolineae bacterium]|nr:PD40 domain-containing protein [Anaerolineae bacterium]
MKKRTSKVVFALTLLLALLLAAPGTITAQSGDWRVTTVESLADFDLTTARLHFAPDGHHAAHDGENALCVLDVLTVTQQCVEVPEESGYTFDWYYYYSPLCWSPDSSQIALVGVPYKIFRDTDLGLLDAAALELIPLVDDGFVGSLITPEDLDTAQNAISVEIQPAWSPDGSLIAVEQATITEEAGIFSADLALVDAATGDVRELIALPGHTDSQADAGATMGMAWSPDGTTIALSLRRTTPNFESDGVWLVDVESGEGEQVLSLQQAADLLQADFPEADVIATFIAPLSWSPDGSRLLFWINDPIFTGAVMRFWMDMDSREIISVEALAYPDEPERAQSTYPMQAAWSPNGSTLLIATSEMKSVPADVLIPLDPQRERANVSLHLIDAASGERTLLGHLPMVSSPMYVAAWGPDGDVLINGYHLKLEQP